MQIDVTNNNTGKPDGAKATFSHSIEFAGGVLIVTAESKAYTGTKAIEIIEQLLLRLKYDLQKNEP